MIQPLLKNGYITPVPQASLFIQPDHPSTTAMDAYSFLGITKPPQRFPLFPAQVQPLNAYILASTGISSPEYQTNATFPAPCLIGDASTTLAANRNVCLHFSRLCFFHLADQGTHRPIKPRSSRTCMNVSNSRMKSYIQSSWKVRSMAPVI